MHEAKGFRVVFLAPVEKDLASEADAEHGLLFPHGPGEDAVEALAGEDVHGLSGGTDAREDDAFTGGETIRAVSDGRVNAEMPQRPEDAGLVAGTVIKNSKHRCILNAFVGLMNSSGEK